MVFVPKLVDQNRPTRVQILDCTLRDGGYYNDWDYPFELVKRYVDVMAAAAIDVVELGFRTLQRDVYLGPTAYTTDSFIERLNPARSLQLAVMLNAKELLAATDPRLAVRTAFARRAHSAVGLVRIAANQNEIDRLGPAIEELQELGYDVALNLMQVSETGLDMIEAFGAQAKQFGVAYAYIADSFGALRPAEISPIMTALGTGFGTNIGCHLHDNMSYALANTMLAIDAGAVIVDSTIQGMGRGPGNVRTEYVVMELDKRGLTKARVNPLVNLVENDFATMKAEYGWGSNLYYFQSANLSVHPTYVMELTKDDRYSPSEIVSALNWLHTRGATSFDVRRLTEAVQSESLHYPGGSKVHDWFMARDVLVVANGPEARAKRDEIEMFIRKHQPFVIGLNAHLPIDTALVDAVAVCHPERAVLDASALTALECEIVAPRSLLESIGVNVKTLRDVGYRVASGQMTLERDGVVIPHPVVGGYVLAMLGEGSARRVLLAGFDGYTDADPRHIMMQESLDLMSNHYPKVVIRSLTRTSFNVQHLSFYEW